MWGYVMFATTKGGIGIEVVLVQSDVRVPDLDVREDRVGWWKCGVRRGIKPCAPPSS